MPDPTQIPENVQTIEQLGKPWHGTVVAILLDLANSLDLESVCEEEVTRLIPDETAAPQTVQTPTPKVAEVAVATPPVPAQPITVNLASFGTELLARETGLAIRAELATLLADGSRIIVNLDGINDITPSVADECFGKLAEKLGTSKFRHRVEFTGGTALMHRLIEFVLAQRANRDQLI